MTKKITLKDKPDAVRGVTPPVGMVFISSSEENKNFLKMWEAASIKPITNFSQIPIIWGTGGELSEEDYAAQLHIAKMRRKPSGVANAMAMRSILNDLDNDEK